MVKKASVLKAVPDPAALETPISSDPAQIPPENSQVSTPAAPIQTNPKETPDPAASTPEKPISIVEIDAGASLADEILKSQPKPEPEGIKSAAELKKRGRPIGSKTNANASGIITKKKAVPTWPDGRPIDFEACEIAAEQTTHASLLIFASVFGDATLVKGQTKEAKEQEEVIVSGWKRYYEKFGIKESDPRLSLVLGYAALGAVHMQKPKTRKKVIKRVSGVVSKVKLAWAYAKDKFNSIRNQ